MCGSDFQQAETPLRSPSCFWIVCLNRSLTLRARSTLRRQASTVGCTESRGLNATLRAPPGATALASWSRTCAPGGGCVCLLMLLAHQLGAALSSSPLLSLFFLFPLSLFVPLFIFSSPRFTLVRRGGISSARFSFFLSRFLSVVFAGFVVRSRSILFYVVTMYASKMQPQKLSYRHSGSCFHRFRDQNLCSM